MFHDKPRAHAVALLERLKDKVSLTLHEDEITHAIESLEL
jgi:hypothetical protein